MFKLKVKVKAILFLSRYSEVNEGLLKLRLPQWFPVMPVHRTREKQQRTDTATDIWYMYERHSRNIYMLHCKHAYNAYL